MTNRRLGFARRIRVRMPLSGTRAAWDCRSFGLGRVIAPCAAGEIDLAEGIHLNLATGELTAESSVLSRSA